MVLPIFFFFILDERRAPIVGIYAEGVCGITVIFLELELARLDICNLVYLFFDSFILNSDYASSK